MIACAARRSVEIVTSRRRITLGDGATTTTIRAQCPRPVYRYSLASHNSLLTSHTNPVVNDNVNFAPVRVRFIRRSRKQHDRTPLIVILSAFTPSPWNIAYSCTAHIAIECLRCFWERLKHEPTTNRVPHPCLSRPSVLVPVNRAMLELGECLWACVVGTTLYVPTTE